MARVKIISKIDPNIWERQKLLAEFYGVNFKNIYTYSKTYNLLEKNDFTIFYGKSPVVLGSRSVNYLFITEPPEIKVAKLSSINKFDLVISPSFYKKQIYFEDHPSLPWHLGIDFSTRIGKINLGAYELNKIPVPKNEKISIIVSDKSITKDQVQRKKVAFSLKEILGDRVDVYGRNIQSISDKWEVLQKSSIHVAMENSSYPNYWSEKLSDPILANNYVFYYGSNLLPKNFATVEKFDIYENVEILAAKLNAFAVRVWEKNLSERKFELNLSRRTLVVEESFHPKLENLC